VKPAAGISGIQRGNMKGEINELATHIENKNIRDLQKGINEFKKGYQPRIYLLNYDELTDSHKFFNRLKNYFSQLSNVHRVSNFRQIKMHTL
jgi:hypothetical protein